MWEGNRDKCCLDRREGAPSRHLSKANSGLAPHRALGGMEGTKNYLGVYIPSGWWAAGAGEMICVLGWCRWL